MLTAPQKEARLVENGAEIHSFVDQRVAAVRIVGDTRSPGMLASAVYFKTRRRYFLLTAGHVARDVAERGESHFQIVVSTSPNRFRPKVASARDHSVVDAGYLEIAGHDANTVDAKGYVFVAPKNVRVFSRAELLQQRDALIVGGYPGALAHATDRGPLAVSLQFLGVIPSDTPQSNWFPDPANTEVVHLGLSAEGASIRSATAGRTTTLPSLSGVSGGGCWTAAVEASPWQASLMKLVAIHAATVNNNVAGAKPPRFAREVLVGYHLRMLCDDFEDVRAELLEIHPRLLDDCWRGPAQ